MIAAGPAGLNKESNVVAGAVNIGYSSSAVSGTLFSSPTDFNFESVGPQSVIVGCPSKCTTAGKEVGLVVESNRKLVTGQLWVILVTKVVTMDTSGIGWGGHTWDP